MLVHNYNLFYKGNIPVSLLVRKAVNWFQCCEAHVICTILEIQNALNTSSKRVFPQSSEILQNVLNYFALTYFLKSRQNVFVFCRYLPLTVYVLLFYLFCSQSFSFPLFVIVCMCNFREFARQTFQLINPSWLTVNNLSLITDQSDEVCVALTTFISILTNQLLERW